MDISGLNAPDGAGGATLQPGVYTVQVAEVDTTVKANSGSKGFQITYIEPESGGRIRETVWLYGPDGGVSGGAWKARSIAEAVGMSDEELRDFNPNLLKGRMLKVVVEMEKSYKDAHKSFPAVTNHQSVDSDRLLAVDAPVVSEPVVDQTPLDELSEEEVPF